MKDKQRTDQDSRLPAPVTAPRKAPGAEPLSDDVINDFLDHLCAPLIGVVAYAERCRLREETGYHLERVANSYVVAGSSPYEAACLAVENYGDSRVIGDRLLESRLRARMRHRIFQRMHPAELRALTWFGIANACVAILLQMRVYLTDLLASSRLITFGLDPAQIRQIIPRPVPLPQTDPFYWLLFAFLLVAPIVAGFLTGTQAPVQSTRGVYIVQTSLTLYTFLFGFLMLPVRDGLVVAVFQLFYWLPAGCLSATVGTAMTGRRRYRYTGLCEPYLSPLAIFAHRQAEREKGR